MIKQKSLLNIMFLDIETAGGKARFEELDTLIQAQWSNKCSIMRRHNKDFEAYSDAELYIKRSAIFAEFAKVVCISTGFFSDSANGSACFSIRSFSSRDEHMLLSSWLDYMAHYFPGKPFNYICGHNIREFDIPFLCRRLLLNGIALPRFFDFRNKRPWQINTLIDTLDLWRFGDYKNYSSLELLACIFGLPTSKSDMSGADVHAYYYEKEDLDSIQAYCESDVVCTAALYLKLMGIDQKLIQPEQAHVIR